MLYILPIRSLYVRLNNMLQSKKDILRGIAARTIFFPLLNIHKINR